MTSESAGTVHPVPLSRLLIKILSISPSIRHCGMPLVRLLTFELMASQFFTHLMVHPSSPYHPNLFSVLGETVLQTLLKSS